MSPRRVAPTKQADPPSIRLDDQLCFMLYAASRAIQQIYRPALQALGVTYPQYLVLLVLWEEDDMSVGSIGRRLMLETGTLTPLIKRLEAAELVSRTRDPQDERVVRVRLTKQGRALRRRGPSVPQHLIQCMVEAAGDESRAGAAQVSLDAEELSDLRERLRTLLAAMHDAM
ncbi:MAG: MarR family transcriptional regulator [Nannocystaceae bacterium]|nr:MarR family transcriptional regulator [Nannocystaceae bacterium]